MHPLAGSHLCSSGLPRPQLTQPTSVHPATSAPLVQLITQRRLRLSRYRTTIEQDEATIADPSTGPRQTVAARLLKIEKGILQGCLAAVMALPGAEEAAAHGPMPTAIMMD